ncbi:MAG TPA: YdeI/OmpD-associated family protein [Rhodanobacteraceae bacterium]|nr:YdeI/OmpD-associated family protein [Rhodanobacteraceae bacterium]
MGERDPRVDVYIGSAAPFAQPILRHLRAVVHATCPQVEESIKWSCPHFVYRGATLCSMAAFKQHCAFGFRLHDQVVGKPRHDGMGDFGRIVSLEGLPSKRTLAAYIKKAMTLNEAGVKVPRAKTPKPPPKMPAGLDVLLAQRKHAAARKVWQGFTDAMRREYVDWIVDAKTDATRQKRLTTTLEWLAQGKQRNWKYM